MLNGKELNTIKMVGNTTKSPNQITTVKDKALSNIIKDDIEGTAQKIINDFVNKFNLFNRNNNFDIKIINGDIRRHKKEKLYIPDDLTYISSFSERIKSSRFIQFLMPQRAIYIILDHLYGGGCSGERGRTLSKIDKRMLTWYFEFFNELKDDNYPLIYEITMDLKSAYPLEQLFDRLDLIIGYLPIYVNGKPITEGLIRINTESMSKVLASLHERRKLIYKNMETTKEVSNRSLLDRKATMMELDEMIDRILRQ